jgi:elongation factor Ts
MNNAIELIKQLRESTGAGVQDCRKALDQSKLDYKKALGILRELDLEKAAKRTQEPTAHGVIEVYSHGFGRVAVMVEVNTETDFAAKSPDFRSFAHEIALHIAASAPLYVRDEDIPETVIAQTAEDGVVRAREEGKKEELIPIISEGTLKKYRNKTVLLRQPYFRDETMTVEQYLTQTAANLRENVIIRRFSRWELYCEKNE